MQWLRRVLGSCFSSAMRVPNKTAVFVPCSSLIHLVLLHAYKSRTIVIFFKNLQKAISYSQYWCSCSFLSYQRNPSPLPFLEWPLEVDISLEPFICTARSEVKIRVRNNEWYYWMAFFSGKIAKNYAQFHSISLSSYDRSYCSSNETIVLNPKGKG